MNSSHSDPWSRLKKLTSSTYAISLLFVLLAGFSGGMLGRVAATEEEGAERVVREEPFAFGGPSEEEAKTVAFVEGAIKAIDDVRQYQRGEIGAAPSADGTLLGASSPVSNVLSQRNGIKTYKIQEGDTLSEIAARFGVSLETLRWANPGLRSLIRVGNELVVPPVNGVIYEVREGDSIESVASKYRIQSELVIKYNLGHQKLFDAPGSKVVLPYAEPLASGATTNLPNLRHYFALPARGWNWGALHFDNAVDIADNCGSPIYASAEGLVIESSAEGYWNQGYGNLIAIEHPNGTQTKYAHVEESLVKVGDYVAQGDKIATIGNTGKTHGPTGCHLHFEVVGAQNPFVVR